MSMFSTRTRVLIGVGGALLILTLLAILLFRMVPTTPQPTSFVATDQTHFHFIEWQKKSDGTLTGQWTMFTQNENQALPVVTPLPPLVGQITDQTITLSAGTSASVQGTIDANTIQGTTVANGFNQSLTWYAATSDQSDKLEAAFTKYEHLQGQLAVLQQTVATPPADSDPTSYALQIQNAQTTVNNLKLRASALQQLGNVCGTGELALFEEQYPPIASTFEVAPYPTAQQALANSTLAKTYQSVQSSWQTASAASIPTIPGLALPWHVSLSAYQSQTKQTQKALTTLQNLVQTDYQNMASLQQQSQAVGDTVQQLRLANGC